MGSLPIRDLIHSKGGMVVVTIDPQALCGAAERIWSKIECSAGVVASKYECVNGGVKQCGACDVASNCDSADRKRNTRDWIILVLSALKIRPGCHQIDMISPPFKAKSTRAQIFP